MNKERRKQIAEIITKLNDLRQGVETLKGDEEDALDNLPDSFRETEKGERMEEIISNIEEAGGYIDEAITCLEAAVE